MILRRAIIALLLLALPANVWAAYEGFILPNVVTATWSVQSRVFAQDLEILADGSRGNGIVYAAGACQVLPQAAPNMTTRITTGCTIVSQAATATVATGNMTHAAAHATFVRLDIISVDNAGTKVVTAGTPAAIASVIPPAIPQSGGVNNIVLAFVYIPAADTTVDATQIVDKRIFVNTPGSGSGAATTLSYLTKVAEGTLSNEFALGSLATGLLINTTTTGVPTIYAGQVCTNQFVTATSASGALTCTTDTLASAQHANQGTTTQVLHGNAAGNPSWGAVSLTADVSGVAPVANGGTNLASGTSGGVLAYTAAGVLASSGALTANLPVIGGGAGVVPTVGTRSGNTTAYVTTTGTQTSGDCVKIDANGNHIANGSSCAGSGAPSTATYITQTADAGLSAEQALSSLSTGYMKVTTGTGAITSQVVPFPVADGGTGLTAGTSGGVLAYTASGTLASSGALTANLPVIGGGAGVAPTVGTRSGNTTAYVTTTGTQTSGDCVKIDANGNHIANGSACAGGSSATTVLALTSDATANATTTGVEITGINQTTSTGTYTFKYWIRYQTSIVTTGVKFGINHTGTATVFMANLWFQALTGAITQHTQASASGAPTNVAGAAARTMSTTAPNLGPTTQADSANADMFAIIEGLIIVTGSGDLELWHASETAASTQVMTGTSLVLTKTN